MSQVALRLEHLTDIQRHHSGIGFEYRTEEEIDRRLALYNVFDEVFRAARSSLLELPLASPVSDVVGKPPRPLTERHLQRLFTTILPEGIPCAVRYEGTVLTAKYLARVLKNSVSERPCHRYHYFQEMLRVELAEELDERHFRSFYQAGVEFFASRETHHHANLIELIAGLITFIEGIGLKPTIRISHVDILREPLKMLALADSDRRRLVSYMEEGDTNALSRLLKVVNSPGDISDMLMALAQRGAMPLVEGISILSTYPRFFREVRTRIEHLVEQLTALDLAKHCQLDPGINRSLDFYSGITLQADAGGIRECAGGGEFTGLVETFGVNGPVYSVGFACGVERLMRAMQEGYEHR